MKNYLFKNGLLLTLPPLFISLSLWGFLPKAYTPEIFNQNIPSWLLLGENIFRLVVFVIPTFLSIESKNKLGWIVYGVGVLIYLLSYLIQIMIPTNHSLILFTAPAWTTLVWFVGIGLLCDKSWLPIPWSKMNYIVLAILFLLFHISHTYLVFLQQQ